MSLSNTSYEILCDLLELRLETFLVTSNEEARELKMLKHAQRELEVLKKMAEPMAAIAGPAVPQTKTTLPASKLPLRLQRLIETEAKKVG